MYAAGAAGVFIENRPYSGSRRKVGAALDKSALRASARQFKT